MTPEQQRIAIAQVCGWKLTDAHVTYPTGLRIAFHPPEYVRSVFLRDCPDYLNDLNAMHEAEKVLVEHHGLYWFTLAKVVSGFKREEFDYSNEYFLKDIACATAAQRAEAFLRTLNLYA